MTKRKTYTSYPQEYWPDSRGIHDLKIGDRFEFNTGHFTFISAERSATGWWVRVEELDYRFAASKNTRVKVRKPHAQPS